MYKQPYPYPERSSPWESLRDYLLKFVDAAMVAEQKTAPDGRSSEPSGAWKSIRTRLNYMSKMRGGRVLEDLISGKIRTSDVSENQPVIFPFGCNSSQKTAVETALQNSLSVIEGPPGTGKTQTILNIIANLLLAKKTIAVVSNNNAATANVTSKLAKENLDWLVAELGKNQNKSQFFDRLSKNLITVTLPVIDGDIPSATEIQELSKTVDEIFVKRLRLQKLKADIQKTDFQRTVFLEDVNKRENAVDILQSDWYLRLEKLTSEKIDRFEQYFLQSQNADGIKRLWLRLLMWLFFGIGSDAYLRLPVEAATVQDAILLARTDAHLRDWRSEKESLVRWLDDHRKSEADFVNASRRYFLAKIREQFSQYEKGKNSSGWSERSFRSDRDFFKRFPIVTSSTYSLYFSSPDSGFDWVIMDEASQVNLPTAFSCFDIAKQAVVVGDTKQLPAILPDVKVKASAELLHKGFSDTECKIFDAGAQNVLDTILRRYDGKVPRTLLREHYRCHPDIIEFCNRMFYNDELIVMTERPDDTVPFELVISERAVNSNSWGSSYVNVRQLEDTENVCLQLTEEGVSPVDIGIISPYRDQINATKRLLPDIEAGTVHSYQGREKDVIVFAVAKNKPTPFLNDPNLLNVAVSRAKSHFVLISSAFEAYPNSLPASLIKYIQYLKPELRQVRESKYRSIFDRLSLSGAADVKTNAGESPAEAIFRQTLKGILEKDDRFSHWTFVQEYPLLHLPTNFEMFTRDERRFMEKNSRLDFLVFDKVNNEPLFAFEVDGASFHKEGSVQDSRDRLKDAIMEKLGIPLKRFRTDSAKGGEVQALESILGDFYEQREPQASNSTAETEHRPLRKPKIYNLF